MKPQVKVAVPVMDSLQLVEILAMLDLNQMQLARLLNVAPRRVRYWVAGERDIPTEVAMLLNLMIDTGTEPSALRIQPRAA